MAGTFSPKNVGKLLIAKGNRAGDTITEYRANAVAANLSAAVIGADGSATALGKKFKVYVKENDGVSGINFSDTIDPSAVDSIGAFKYIPETAKTIEVIGFNGAVVDNATYRVSIKKYDGIQSPENFRYVEGFAVTKPNTTMTNADVINEIVKNLTNTLKRENSLSEFTITGTPTSIVISNKPQTYVRGKIQGLPVNFKVEVSVKVNSPADLSSGSNLGILSTVTTVAGSEGQGTGKQVANLEYFLKGYENADYGREVGFPANFNVDYLANVNSKYNAVNILFHKDRQATNVERQPKELTVVFDEAYTDAIAEVSTITVTAAASAAGNASVSLNGTTVSLPLTASTIAINAAEIAATIDALEGYTAVTDGVSKVTITSLIPGSETNIATYAAGTATNSAATLATVTNGAAAVPTYTAINAFLAQLRVPMGSAAVPANLS